MPEQPAGLITPLGQTRIWGILTVMYMSIIVGYTSVNNTLNPTSSKKNATLLNEWGGASTTSNSDFSAYNAWDFHIIFFTLAYSLALAESAFSFSSPILAKATSSQLTHHLLCQLLVIVFTIAGMVAIVNTKNSVTGVTARYGTTSLSGLPSNAGPHMYSPHAWTGVVVLVLYFKQVVLGLCLFVFFKDPLSDSPWLTTLSRWHVILGRLALLGGLEACVNGWMDLQMIMRMYGQFFYNSNGMMESAIGLVIYVQMAFLAYHFYITPIQDVFPKSKEATATKEAPALVNNVATEPAKTQPAVDAAAAPAVLAPSILIGSA